MTLDTVTIRRFALDLVEPLRTAAGVIETREGFVVQLETPDGTTGFGEATPLPGWTESLADCQTALETAREELRSGDVADVLDRIDPRETPAARHAIELAHLDRGARSKGIPLSRHLGGADAATAVPVNATVGDGSPEETARRAVAAVDAGFGCVKVKVGSRSVEEDVERVAAVRKAVGPGVEIRCDANGAWRRDQATRAFDALVAHDVSYVEQPLDPGDLDGHAILRGGDIGVALDESVGRSSPEAILDREAADVLVCKPMALGGVRPTLEIARMAREEGVRTVITTTIDAVVARTGAVHLAACLPDAPACGLATAELLAEDVGPDPAPVEEGTIRVPQGPGLGIEEVWTG